MTTPRTHCRNGHELTSENLYVTASGRRECRACRRAGAKRVYEANFRGHQHAHRVRSDRRPKEIA